MKYVFVGNRKFVLEEMIKNKLNIVNVFVVKHTYLEKDIPKLGLKYETISNKASLLEKLEETEYDILISNGCPFILPVKKLKKAKYVNIHPSFLPDLRGVDPVIGAILFERDSGATCHVMDEGIDTGDIISQVKIPYSEDLDVSLLYQLSFIAEKRAFNLALTANFLSIAEQEKEGDYLYYKRAPKDKFITFKETNKEIKNKIKAFNNKSQGCQFCIGKSEFKVYEISKVENDFVFDVSKSFKDLEIIFCYEESIIFKKDEEIIKFSTVVGDLTKVKVGDVLGQMSR